mmetsp:Transcript_15647/g.27444  ORF Transcript_15647/g.27444 Transcript_15647/m.27444 type:complete len:363 (-) Transcript_15647:64-1152(-)
MTNDSTLVDPEHPPVAASESANASHEASALDPTPVDDSALSQVAKQLLDLCSDQEMQPVIAREEGCMSALVKVCGSTTTVTRYETCFMALKAIEHLSNHPDNKYVLRMEDGLFDSLRFVMLGGRTDADKNMRTMAFGVMEMLTEHINYDEVQELKRLQRKLAMMQKKDEMVKDKDDALIDEIEAAVMEKFAVYQTERGNVVQIAAVCAYRYISPGISGDEKVRIRLERILLKLAGIIAISFEIGAEIIDVSTKLDPEWILEIIKDITKQPETKQIQNETDAQHGGGEDDEGHGTDDVKHSASHDTKDKGYLDHASRRPNKANANKTVASSGMGNSLAARLEEQKRAEQRRKQRQGRFLNWLF